MRKRREILSEDTVDPDPFHQFERWYHSRLSEDIPIPDNVYLGTSSDGQPSVRTVLLKGFDEKGFVFFSNYRSKKAIQLDANPKAALLFYWPESSRQVRIEGSVFKISAKESDLYFNSRPEESRLSAWASEQSSVIPDRQYLENRFLFYKTFFSKKSIERPPQWGGYKLIPAWFEFWEEREFRLHDRICYTLADYSWIIKRLAP